MRRFVDTLILLLVAYTVTWPLFRGWYGRDAIPSPLVVEVRGLEAQEATVHIATGSEPAARQEWAAVARCLRDVEAPTVPHLGARESVWVVVQVDAQRAPAYELAIDRSSNPARLVVDLPFRLETDLGTTPAAAEAK